MSYILDALKRADAERGRGAVPGLNAQPLPGVTSRNTGPGTGPQWTTALAVALAVGGIAAGIWVWRNPPASDRPNVVLATASVPLPVAAQPTVASAPGVQPGVPQPPLPPIPMPSPAPVAPAPAPAPIPDPSLTPAPQAIPSGPGLLIPGPAVDVPPITASPTPLVPPTATAAAASVNAPPLAAPASATPRPKPETAQVAPARTATATLTTPKSPAMAASTQASPAIAPLLSELPDELRRTIPPLTITGAVDSKNPAQRLLLVNGQVLPQGAAAAPEVMIEEIRARSTTFSFRGTRFRLSY